MILSRAQNSHLQLFSTTMLHASHASCEAALCATLRHAEALAEQSAPPSLQAFLADTSWLDYQKGII